MRVKLSHLICLFAVVFAFSARAQSDLTDPEIVSHASSPDMTGSKRLNCNMNYYDGTMNIRISLHTLSDFGQTVPIELRYKTSGIKVESVASSIGLGWEISAGGKVSRIVQRKPDESDTGICNDVKRTPQQMYLACFGNTPPSAELFWGVLGKREDTEPDLFYFEIPNYSGLFVCDTKGIVHTIPYQNIDIRWVDKSYFIIQDPAGNIYTLGKTDASRETSVFNNGDESITYISTWMLDNIEDQFNNQIQFSYRAGLATTTTNYRQEYTFSSRSYSDVPITDPKKNDYKTTNKNTTLTIEAPKYLSSIRSKNTTVSFDLTNRNDIQNALKYAKIRIATGGAPETSISFKQSYFTNGALKLDAIDKQEGANIENIAKFHYCTTPHPPVRSTTNFDHWGYYNGKNNTSKFPRFKTGNILFSGADRTPDLESAQAAVLTRIENHLGGYTEYKYELNTINENGVTIDIGGLRIKQVISSDGKKADTVSLYYTTSTTSRISSGIRAGQEPRYHYVGENIVNGEIGYLVLSHRNDEIFNMQGNAAEYYMVREKLPNGSYNIHEYLTNNDPQCKDVKGVDYFCNGSSFVSGQTGGRGNEILSSRFWRRGLLYKTTHYDANGVLISNKVNNYSFGEPKSVIQGYIPRYNKADIKRSYLRNYSWQSESVYLDKTITEAGPYNTKSVVEYKYDTTYMVPTEIKETDGLNNITTKRFFYPFNYVVTPDPYLPYGGPADAIELLQRKKMIVPIETTILKNGRIIQSEYTRYQVMLIKASADKPDNIYAVVPSLKCILPLAKPLTSRDFSPMNVQNGSNLVIDPRYKIQVDFNNYNQDGQLLSYHAPDGINKSIIYGYNGTLPIAQVDNAIAAPQRGELSRGYTQVFHTSFEDDKSASYGVPAKTGERVYYGPYSIDLKNFATGSYILTYWQSADWGATWSQITNPINVDYDSTTYTIGGNYHIDEVRIIPSDARMETCTYRPGVGKTSETDYNGISIYYEYDKFGRMTRVLDDSRNPVKSYEYHFNNQ